MCQDAADEYYFEDRSFTPRAAAKVTAKPIFIYSLTPLPSWLFME
jgi:hypothetical protein